MGALCGGWRHKACRGHRSRFCNDVGESDYWVFMWISGVCMYMVAIGTHTISSLSARVACHIMSCMAVFDLNQPASSVSEEDNVFVTNSHVESVSSSGVYSFASHDDNNASSVRRYASEAGFGVRLSCQKRLKCGYVKTKYLVCNREGCPKEVWLNTLDPKKNDRQVRSSNFRVCGCKARVQFDMVQKTLKYRLVVFDLEHNHELDRIEYKYLSKAKRKLTYNEQLFIIKAANSNIGAVRAHNLYSSLKGSSSLVHGTQTEFKNFTCGVNCFIRDSDAQMLITRFEERQEFTKGFSFDYFVEDAELCGLFWADEVVKYNYIEFGDIVSFDATYKTNKYKMVFVPLNAIDNHRRSVTVGSGLLKRETAEAYGWLLRAFKKAFIRALNIIVTDQDGAMRLAVAAEFPESEHRLCIIYDETDFKEKFGKIVWNMFIGPEEFEDKWNKLMEEFNLVNHKWLSKMYRLRSSWIPAFFVDSPLCGLMRTTSRSESENSFFSYFLSSGATLVKFMLCYESAMERQRQTQEKLDHQSFDSFPNLLTPLPIEDHASKVYTRSLFIRVQKEIVAGSWLCSITGMSSDEGCTVCTIDEDKVKPVGFPEVIDKENTSENVDEEINLHQKHTGYYKVLYNKGDSSVTCCCQLFVRSGILCRHIFCVFKNFKVSCIPDQYILRRWTKDLIPPDLRNKKNRYGEKNEAIEKLSMEASIILDSFSDFVEEFMGVKKPNQVKVRNPTGVKPKGREKGKRIKSGREISMKKSNKKKSGCGICGSTSHNRRTCPGKDNPDALYPAVLVSGGNDHADGGSRDGSSGSGSV
ncbi:FAR1-related sequence 9-like protein [Tanacetum coccineum]|uniref:FAR1-related sequence 9-like protein n=1 Tax=Tanacetum coccineum TaxID=301880 RepID=A0ABQ5CKU9_9ASTR